MSRASNRVGFGNNRGAGNPKITVSDTAPSSPKNNDIWIDTATPAIKIWNATGSSWDTVATT
jgi:hypothetical protein